MMLMRSRKTRPAQVAIGSDVRELNSQLSFLDVLRQACARNERCTLTVESEGTTYTILVDRGGPFNATGGGTTGSPALASAAQLRRGRSCLTPGWPVDQPLYQPGLDRALEALLPGVVEPSLLPRARGVDSLRNSDFHADAAAPAPPADAFGPRAEQVSPLEPLIAAPPQPAPAPPPNPLSVAETAPPVVFMEPTAANPPAPEVARGGASLLATRGLLWALDINEPASEYTLKTAATLFGRSFVDGLSDMVHPVRRGVDARVSRAKADWAKSGEVAAKVSRKARHRAAETDPDREPRLR